MPPMKLAKRMDELAPERAFSVFTQAQALEAQGKKILHFEIGQPDFKTPQNIVEAGKRALDEGKTRYTQPLGIPELRKAIAEYFSATRAQITPSQVAITPSPKMAIYLSMIATLNPGDEVIYPDPGFPTYEILTGFFDCVKKPVPLIEENNFSFDMDAFRKNFSPRTKLVILNSPSNPTGGIIPKKDLEEIAQMVLSNPDCYVMSDEIYARIMYLNQEFVSIASLPGMKDRAFVVDGFSKTYAMTGWRVGFLLFPEQFEEKMDWLATNTYSCVAQFTQYAALEALTGPQDKVDEMVKEFRVRRDALVSGLNSIPGVTCKVPEGAFYVFPNVTSFKKTSREIAEYLLAEAGVAVLDGTAFGKYGEGYLRLSYTSNVDNITQAVSKIKDALARM